MVWKHRFISIREVTVQVVFTLDPVTNVLLTPVQRMYYRVVHWISGIIGPHAIPVPKAV